MQHKTTTGLNIKIGGIYTFTNKHGYTTEIKVVRVSEKSIYAYHKLQDGNFSNYEFREGVTEFLKYTLTN